MELLGFGSSKTLQVFIVKSWSLWPNYSAPSSQVPITSFRFFPDPDFGVCRPVHRATCNDASAEEGGGGGDERQRPRPEGRSQRQGAHAHEVCHLEAIFILKDCCTRSIFIKRQPKKASRPNFRKRLLFS